MFLGLLTSSGTHDHQQSQVQHSVTKMWVIILLCFFQWSVATSVPLGFPGGTLLPMISATQDLSCLDRNSCRVLGLSHALCDELVLPYARKGRRQLETIPFTMERSVVDSVPAVPLVRTLAVTVGWFNWVGFLGGCPLQWQDLC